MPKLTTPVVPRPFFPLRPLLQRSFELPNLKEIREALQQVGALKWHDGNPGILRDLEANGEQ